MASIDREIDEAMVQQKARAADQADEFTSAYPCSLADIGTILERMHVEAAWAVTGHGRDAILDTMNLCALALSLLPKEET